LDAQNEFVAAYSSAGPSLHELSGRVKPDILTHSTNIQGFSKGTCRTSSGTSIASPILTAGLALVLSKADKIVSPALLKQAMIRGADLIPGVSVFEQGAGVFNLTSTLDQI
jgi:membrane-bound transcription factor site-1 protease